MLKNFFKSAYRSLWKNRSYSFLNIFGLAIGVACAGFIFLWVEDEMNYDNVFAKKDLLYNIPTNQTYNGAIRTFISTPAPLAEAMKTEIPGVANTCRMNRATILFSVGEKGIFEKGCYTDASFFSMFTPGFIEGDAKTAFLDLNSVVISETMARQFFGDERNVVGKTIRLDNKDEFIVKGVIKDLPSNATFQLDWYAPFEIYYNSKPFLSSWNSFGTNTYVELLPSANPETVNRQLMGMLNGKSANGSTTQAFLFSMNDWRLRDHFESGKQVGGRIEFVRMFTLIAWIILLIACINFMNLSTARSEKRAKEVGVRKVMGANKKMLFLQFIGESVVTCTLAVMVGVGIIALLLPAFNTVVEKKLLLHLGSPLHLGFLLLTALVCGLLSGSYPALYLSSFNPVFVLKGLKQNTGSASLVRKGLVVMQFTISIVLIIGTVIIYQQIQHVKGRDLGYDRENLISVPVHGTMTTNFSSIKQDLLNTGMVENAGLNSFNTTDIGNNTSGLDWKGKAKDRDILISNRQISPELIPTLGLHVKEGRNFTADMIADSNNVLITESFASLMGKESPIGKTISDGDKQYKVVGVVNDFLYGDMYGQSDPILFRCAPDKARYLYIRVKDKANTQSALSAIETILHAHDPAYPFGYSFVDDQFNEEFKSEMLIGKLSRVFALLAIIISCLGLFGLAAYTAERRTKEIGIRKVLGAGTTGIAALLSKEFLQLVLISTIVAYPIAWWAMAKWLQGYAYRITMSWWVFLLAGIAAMLIAVITVSFQAVKAAVANPVRSLRNE